MGEAVEADGLGVTVEVSITEPDVVTTGGGIEPCSAKVGARREMPRATKSTTTNLPKYFV